MILAKKIDSEPALWLSNQNMWVFFFFFFIPWGLSEMILLQKDLLVQ